MPPSEMWSFGPSFAGESILLKYTASCSQFHHVRQPFRHRTIVMSENKQFSLHKEITDAAQTLQMIVE
jgi:alpha-tubulin suppressor-like RCC1 family protein